MGLPRGVRRIRRIITVGVPLRDEARCESPKAEWLTLGDYFGWRGRSSTRRYKCGHLSSGLPKIPESACTTTSVLS